MDFKPRMIQEFTWPADLLEAPLELELFDAVGGAGPRESQRWIRLWKVSFGTHRHSAGALSELRAFLRSNREFLWRQPEGSIRTTCQVDQERTERGHLIWLNCTFKVHLGGQYTPNGKPRGFAVAAAAGPKFS